MKNEFLTDIAKGLNDKIEQVRLEKLPVGHLGRTYASENRGSYCISIDIEKLFCCIQVLFVLYHEVAHAELFHFGDKFNFSDECFREAIEKEADEWAFEQFGITKDDDNINDTDRICLLCLRSLSKRCLKGFQPHEAKINHIM